MTRRRNETVYRLRWRRLKFTRPSSQVFLSKKRAEAKRDRLRDHGIKRFGNPLAWVDLESARVTWTDLERESPETNRDALESTFALWEVSGRPKATLPGLASYESGYALARESDRAFDDEDPGGHWFRDEWIRRSGTLPESGDEALAVERVRLDAVIDAWLGR